MQSYDKVVDTFPIDVQDQVYADCMRILLGKGPQHTDESGLKNMIDAASTK